MGMEPSLKSIIYIAGKLPGALNDTGYLLWESPGITRGFAPRQYFISPEKVYGFVPMDMDAK